MADLSPAQLEALSNAISGLGRTTNDLDAAQQAAISAQRNNTDAIKKTSNYFQDLSRALVSTQQGMGKYAGAVEGAIGAGGALASNFGILGAAVGGLAKLIGGLAAQGLKQNDALIRSYRTMSQFGALNLDESIDGIEQLKDQFKALGTTAENAEYFQRLIGEIAPDLATLAGTVGEGKAKIVGVVDVLLKTEEERLKNLGYTTESIAEFAGKFTATQARVGINQGNTNVQLANSAAKYMQVLTELSSLTGQSRDKLQQQLEAQTRDVSFRAYLTTLEPKERAAAMAAVQAAQGMSQAAGEAAMEMLTMGGGIRTQSTALFQTQFPEFYQVLQKSIKTARESNTVQEAQSKALFEVLKGFQLAGPSLRSNIGQFAQTIMAGGKEAAASLNITSETYDMLERLDTMSDQDLDKFAKHLQAIMNQTGNRMQQQTQMDKDDRLRQNALQDAYYNTASGVIPAMLGFSGLINELGLGLAKFIRATTFGTVDFVDSFRRFDNFKDVADALSEYKKKEEELLKDRIAPEQKLRELLRDKIAQEQQLANLPYEERQSKMKGITEKVSKAQQAVDEIETKLRSVRAAQQNAQSMGQAFGGSGKTTFGEKNTPEQNLRIKQGANAPGAALDPRLVELANKIATEFPDFLEITSMNDLFHQNRVDKNGLPIASKHKEGKALDFTLSKRPTPEQGAKLVEQLKSMGFSYAQDEYNKPSDGSTGGHIHAQLATGGIVRGPKTGYPAMLHGTEAVLPMNMFKDFGNMITKFPFTSGSSMPGSGDMDSLIKIMEQVYVKIEEMVDYQRATKFVQEDILVQVKH